MPTVSPSSPIGSTGISVPPIVFGSSALGNLYVQLSQDVKQAIVSAWFDHPDGVVAADSAGKYGAGLALEEMAKGMKAIGIKPEQVVISNKLGWRRVPLKTPEPTFEPGAWVNLEHDAVQDISYDGILRCWEQGCELLHPYKPQMISVHDPDEYLAAATGDDDRKSRMDDIIGAYQALTELRDRGDAAAIGVGSKDWKVSQQLAESCDLDWVMLATSLTIYTHPQDQLDFVETLRKREIAVINSAVFQSGFLTGGDFFDYRKVTGESEEDRALIAWRERLREVCRRFDVTPAAACVAFGMSPPGVVAIALNSSRPAMVKQNVELCHNQLPNEFWLAMKESGLLETSYPYLGNQF
jgi:D-threo-aldose 1-dehydrogenase